MHILSQLSIFLYAASLVSAGCSVCPATSIHVDPFVLLSQSLSTVEDVLRKMDQGVGKSRSSSIGFLCETTAVGMLSIIMTSSLPAMKVG
ncbi:predicted protein [Pyrenophora tritici-repentis Pt-1C-BFP]|uniref:Uncharacterized protein n=1 Tax=Pyrenophora tritici-repentis (strain Pt-1C-BFP) TaxID=426418 RepID=B2VX10_PYRTR|nr:uncharacterized protein PTRG_00247 [Pyrenophora tritici-repentis Pt-1C-BFP]EDU39685.1 predicted protein [Pyrenophora tritici-repentis Pt-1C-BFP]